MYGQLYAPCQQRCRCTLSPAAGWRVTSQRCCDLAEEMVTSRLCPALCRPSGQLPTRTSPGNVTAQSAVYYNPLYSAMKMYHLSSVAACSLRMIHVV